MKISSTRGVCNLIDNAGAVVPGAIVYETNVDRYGGASALVRLVVEDVEHDGVPMLGAARCAKIATTRAEAVCASFADLSKAEREEAVSLMSDVAPDLFGDPEG